MPTVLIIDDDLDILKMLGELLKRAGYQVVKASDGELGLKEYRKSKPDLVITDIIMPNKEGLEVIMELRREVPKPKIIAISGGGKLTPESYLPLAEKFGADAILEKPFLPSTLLALIKKLLGQAQ